MSFWLRDGGSLPSAILLTLHLLGGVTPMPAQGCTCRLLSTGWGDLVSYPLNSQHTRNSVNTCLGNYSGRCSTTSSTSSINSFPQRKRHHMRYALVPITESSPGQTINFATILLFTCSTNIKFFLVFRWPHWYCIIHACSYYVLLLCIICILNCLFLCFLCHSIAYLKLSLKNLLTYLLSDINQLGLVKRHWNLATSSAEIEFRLHISYNFITVYIFYN